MVLKRLLEKKRDRDGDGVQDGEREEREEREMKDRSR